MITQAVIVHFRGGPIDGARAVREVVVPSHAAWPFVVNVEMPSFAGEHQRHWYGDIFFQADVETLFSESEVDIPYRGVIRS